MGDQTGEKKGDEESKKWAAELRNGVLVGATLVATLAFQAAVTPPGGFWQDDLIVAPDNTLQKNHTAGTPIWRDKCPSEYRMFRRLSIAAFALSVLAILWTAYSVPVLQWFVSSLPKWIPLLEPLKPVLKNISRVLESMSGVLESMSALTFYGSVILVLAAFSVSMHQQGA